MSSTQIEREWLTLDKIRKKLIWLRYGTEDIALQKHYDVARSEIDQALEALRKVIEGE